MRHGLSHPHPLAMSTNHLLAHAKVPPELLPQVPTRLGFMACVFQGWAATAGEKGPTHVLAHGIRIRPAMHFCSAAANCLPSAWGMGVSCTLRDLANLPKPCPIARPRHPGAQKCLVSWGPLLAAPRRCKPCLACAKCRPQTASAGFTSGLISGRATVNGGLMQGTPLKHCRLLTCVGKGTLPRPRRGQGACT